jgi:uncharacterized protein (TIGR02118 family)
MIKIIFCLRRLPTMTRPEFQDYWRNVHAPLVMARAKLLGIHRYVQNHTLADSTFARFAASRGGHPAFDGVAEIWQSDVLEGTVEERRRASQDLLEDEGRFIDLAASPLFFADETEFVSPPGQARA